MAGLSTVAGTGTQSTTQSPQSSALPTSQTAKASNVQPGTASNLLTSPSGVQLYSTPLTTVNFASTASVQQANSQLPTKSHHVNPAAVSFSIILFLIAASLFWLTFHNAKNTTDY